MKISVLIIAHNEEKYIAACLQSILNQTKKPDEIILVVHNSTDRTLELAQKFPISVIPFSGPSGSIYSRIEGLKHVAGDIILCTDGDTLVAKNWVEVMTATLNKNENVLVGSWVKMRGTFYNWISNIYNKPNCISDNNNVERWIWGASFGFWGKDKIFVSEILTKTESLSNTLKLSRNPDDYWLALFMKKRGHLEVTNETSVSAHVKETSNKSALARNLENIRNGNLMEEYFKKLH